MNEIKCPNCGTVFQIDEVDYQSIVKQIRDTEFNREVRLREEQFEKDKDNLIKLNTASVKEQYSELIKNKDVEISDLKNQIKNNDSKVADTMPFAVESAIKYSGTCAYAIECAYA